jgi:hypothetical protein
VALAGENDHGRGQPGVSNRSQLSDNVFIYSILASFLKVRYKPSHGDEGHGADDRRLGR